jgi:hypothetical protein
VADSIAYRRLAHSTKQDAINNGFIPKHVFVDFRAACSSHVPDDGSYHHSDAAELIVEQCASALQKFLRSVVDKRDGTVPFHDVGADFLTKFCGCPAFFSIALLRTLDPDAVTLGNDWNNFHGLEAPREDTRVKASALWQFFDTLRYANRAQRYWQVLCPPGQNFLERKDLAPAVQGLINSNSDLSFLRLDSAESEQRAKYAVVVISSIFFTVNTATNGRISYTEFRNSNLADAFELLDRKKTEHVVSFSKAFFMEMQNDFEELLAIERASSQSMKSFDFEKLVSYETILCSGRFSISAIVLHRIFAEVPRRLSHGKGVFDFEDYVWFALCEKDRMADGSVDYWFRCLDYDYDGYLSDQDLKFFYSLKVNQIEKSHFYLSTCFADLAISNLKVFDTLPWRSVLSQVCDLQGGRSGPEGMLHLAAKNIKSSNIGEIIFDIFINLESRPAAVNYLV